jgi:hypothetical protein
MQLRWAEVVSNRNAFFKDLEGFDPMLLHCGFEGFVKFFSAASVVSSIQAKENHHQRSVSEQKYHDSYWPHALHSMFAQSICWEADCGVMFSLWIFNPQVIACYLLSLG